MKQRIVGTYYLGFESCQLVLREGDGANFCFCPEKGSTSRMKVGADENTWNQIVSNLLHESMEFSLTRANCRYIPSQDESNASDQCAFFCSHAQFSAVVAQVAPFMMTCQLDLQKAWKKWQKKKKRKKR